MKKTLYALIFALSTGLATGVAHSQQVCTPLDYQEMRDMPEKELVVEYCKYRKAGHKNGTESVEMMLRDESSLLVERYNNESEKCLSQATRIKRVLTTKGMEPGC